MYAVPRALFPAPGEEGTQALGEKERGRATDGDHKEVPSEKARKSLQ